MSPVRGMVGNMNDDPKRKLSAQDVEAEGLSDWRIMFRTLHARFETGTSRPGLELVNRIGAAAEERNHHPDIDLSYPRVVVRLTSHDTGGSHPARRRPGPDDQHVRRRARRQGRHRRRTGAGDRRSTAATARRSCRSGRRCSAADVHWRRPRGSTGPVGCRRCGSRAPTRTTATPAFPLRHPGAPRGRGRPDPGRHRGGRDPGHRRVRRRRSGCSPTPQGNKACVTTWQGRDDCRRRHILGSASRILGRLRDSCDATTNRRLPWSACARTSVRIGRAG